MAAKREELEKRIRDLRISLELLEDRLKGLKRIEADLKLLEDRAAWLEDLAHANHDITAAGPQILALLVQLTLPGGSARADLLRLFRERIAYLKRCYAEA